MIKYESTGKWCPLARQECRSDCALQIVDAVLERTVCALANAGKDTLEHPRATFTLTKEVDDERA